MDELKLLKDYLVGRTDVYARQLPQGGYKPVHMPITDELLLEHLAGDVTIGTYTINRDGLVRCVTWDFDDKEDPRRAVWAALGFIPYLPGPWMMFESGGKGAHVVQSFNPPIPSELAYWYARNRAQAAGLWKDDEPTIECNPKQDKLTEKYPLGNLTKLPLGVHRVTGRRARMLEGSTVGYAPPPTLREEGAVPVPEAPRGARKAATGYTDRPEGGWIAQAFDGESTIKRGRNNTLRSFRTVLEGLDFPPELVRYNVEYMNSCLLPEGLDQEELDRTVLRELEA